MTPSSPIVARRIAALRDLVARARHQGRIIGLVPTMGALHRGHAKLIETARRECGVVVVTIFVNPTQFGPSEDFSRYPRPFERDVEVCAREGADVIFAPEVSEMYPAASETFVEAPRVAEHLCGASRPGHFRGVATVVTKLLNIVQPDRAYFGEKDFQQLAVIRRLVEDLNLPVTIAPVPTVREADGLALSSRNVYLTPDERNAAPLLSRALLAARSAIEAGETSAATVKAAALATLAMSPLIRVEYFEIVDAREIQPIPTIRPPWRIAAAIHLGSTRLIDNVGP